MSASVPPGDLGLPFVGEGFAFAKDPFTFFEQRFRRHGSVFKTRLFGDLVACVVGPDGFALLNDADAVTRERGSPPHIRELFHPDAIPFLGGERQTARRAALMRAFTPEALAGYEPIVRRVVARTVKRWASAGEVRGVDQLGDLCFSIATAVFVGADPDADDPAMRAVFDTFGRGIFSLPIPLPITAYGKALRARDRLRAFVHEAVAGYRPGTARHGLEWLMGEGGTLAPEEVEIEVLHFLAAATTPLQVAMIHLVRVLAEDRDVADRTRKAAREGDGTWVDAVTREARRRHKIAPSTFFGVLLRDAPLGDYTIPKGWKIVGVTHSTMLDADTFDDPKRFDPSRFVDTPEPPGYVAHGNGPWSGHRCAGERLADLVLRVFVQATQAGHRFELPEQDFSETLGGFSPLPRDGLRMRVVAA